MYVQKVKFDLSKMGHKDGYCLQNVRLGYGIKAKYPDAKSDMEANKKAGTLHDMSSLPTNVTVPVYADTKNVHEHILVSRNGTFYSDGVIINRNQFKYFGWGEMVNDVKVVEYVEGDEDMKVYKNGSTAEEIYADTDCTQHIGRLNPNEQCDCYGIFNNRAVLRYKVDGSSNNYKIGFAKWLGGIKE